jgi:ribosome biogenesis GTPase
LIEQYGWSEKLRQEFAPHAARGHAPGRILVQQRGLYVVAADHGELSAQLSGRLVHEAGEGGYPAVGDWVALAPRPEERAATIHAVLPRRTAFVRKAADTVQTLQVIAANIDIAFVVASMNAELNARRLERYLAAVWQSGARPVVALTKADLADDPDRAVARVLAVAGEAPVLAVSAVTGEGMTALAAHLEPGETCVLVGSSGVGKSTLVNALAGRTLMATGAIREDDAHGRHTTTHRELSHLPGGALIIDTPGLRELGLMDADEGFGVAFEDVEALVARCRFSDCGHTREPGCAVQAALDAGELDPGRWRNFQKLQRELSHLERKEDRVAREAERRRWISISKAQRSHRKLRAWD